MRTTARSCSRGKAPFCEPRHVACTQFRGGHTCPALLVHRPPVPGGAESPEDGVHADVDAIDEYEVFRDVEFAVDTRARAERVEDVLHGSRCEFGREGERLLLEHGLA